MTVLPDELSHLKTSKVAKDACRDISNMSATTLLSSESFDSFCRILEEPIPLAAQELLSRKAIWDK